jgi:ribosomal protein L34E
VKKNTQKEYRIRSAKSWIKTYSGNNVVKAYSKKYAVNKLCTVKELRLIGIEISSEYEISLMNSMEALRQQRLSYKNKKEDSLNTVYEFESDENFSLIIGYTSGGFPYGLTHQE